METETPVLDSNPITAEPENWYTLDGRLRGSAEPIAGKCASHLRGTKPPRYCTQPPMKGKERCMFHGGKTPSALALPQSKTLKYARHMPKPVADDYAGAVANKEQLLDLKYEVALLEEQIDNAVQKKHADTWSGLWDDLQELLAMAEEMDKDSIIDKLHGMAKRGQEHEAARREVEQAVQAKARLVAIESKRMLESSQIMTLDEVTHLFRLLSLAIKNHVQDQATLNAVNADFQSIVRAALPSA